MTLGRITREAWRRNRLMAALVELTYRCNLDCFFCYNDLGATGRPLSTAGWLRLFEELAEMQVLHLSLSGGEPLAHPDFFTLGRRARDLGFLVRIKSNGHALGGRLAQRVREEIDPFLVEVSLHGAQAATHDRQTRVRGSFERLLSHLDEMRRLGLRVKLNSTLTSWNEDEIEAMYALADRLGLRLQVDPEVTPRDGGDRAPLAVSASGPGVRRLLAVQGERMAAAAAAGDAAGATVPATAPGARADDETMPEAAGKHCGAGSSGIAVDPFGNVYPCVAWRRPVGNLHRQSLAEIWSGSPELAAVRGTTAEAARRLAALGPRGRLMNFCPGSAATRTGDPLALYPEAEQRAALLLAEQHPTRTLLPIVD